MPNIAIFASGAGSNAREIIRRFRTHPDIKVKLIACHKPGAGAIGVAREGGIPCLMIEKEEFFRGSAYMPELTAMEIHLIVLAGFLWKIPPALVSAFPRQIINIHPALLPAYGGKGMYGRHVHESVLENGDKQSGITIHYVDNQYDHGETIFQASCEVAADDSPESLAARIHQLEHQHYPRVIEELLSREQQRISR